MSARDIVSTRLVRPVDDGIPEDRFPPADRDVAQLRIPPHSVEAESSVLGGLLLDNSAWDRVRFVRSALQSGHQHAAHTGHDHVDR